ncbi:hypothetical protein OSTOST_18623 [Ostertagia ostertagi]
MTVFIACYNLFFTALPVLAMGALDQDVDDAYSLRYPKLYLPGQFNLFFNMRIFIYSVLHGMFSSLVIFFIPYGALLSSAAYNGKDLDDYSTLAFTTFTALIVVVTGQIAFDTTYWTAISHFVIWGSLIFYFLLAFLIYEGLPVTLLAKTSSTVSYGVAFKTMATPQFWFSILMVTVILLLPVMLNRFFWFDTHPSFADRLRVRKKLGKKFPQPKEEEEKPAFKRSAATRRSVRGSLRSGYAFSHSQGFGDLILKGKLFKNVEQMRTKNNGGRSPRPVLATVNGTPAMLTPVPSQPEVSPSSAGLPVMTLPPQPAVAVTFLPHTLTVNDDEWSLGGDVNNFRGTVIRGDDDSSDSFSKRHPTNDSQARRGTPRKETQVEEDTDVIVERF